LSLPKKIATFFLRWKAPWYLAEVGELRDDMESLDVGETEEVVVLVIAGIPFCFGILTCRYEDVRDHDGKVVDWEWHSTPGGRSGRDGRAGSSATGRLTNGIPGVDGSVEIFIANKKSKLSGPYPSAWSLEVVDYNICDSNDDGIIEFGEEIIIKNIRVRNSGKSQVKV
jgi:hypothetical protein